MTIYLLIQEQQLILGVLGSIKGLGWRPALPMALASKPQKDIWRWHLKSMMLLTAHQLGALRYGELSFITHGASFWRILGAKKMSGEKWSEKLISIVQDNGIAVCKNIHPSLCVSPLCCFLPLATNTHSEKLFYCLISDCNLWTEIRAISCLTAFTIILQWPRALLLAVCAGCVSRDMVRGHWVRSVPRFLSSFCGLDNGKHLESWRQLVRAAHGLTKWPSLWSPLIPGILPGKVESLRAPLLFLTSVLLFWSLKKKLQIFKWCKHLMT